MTEDFIPNFIPTCGHQHFETATGPRHLMFGPTVPEGEMWSLTLLAAKNNMTPDDYPQCRTTAEISVCVWIPPRPSSHEELPPGEWVLLAGDASVPQFKPIKWEGILDLRPGTRLGAWFRGAQADDTLELDAIYDVETLSP